MINQYLGVALSTYLADGINIYIYLLLRLLWLVVSFQGITSSSPSWMISWRNTTPDTSGWWKSGFFNDRSWALRWNKPSLVGGRPQMSRKNILPKKQTKSHWNMMLGRRTFLLNMVPLQDAMLVTGRTYKIIFWNFRFHKSISFFVQKPLPTFPLKIPGQIFDMYARVEDSGGGEPFTPRKVTMLVNIGQPHRYREFFCWFLADGPWSMWKIMSLRIQICPKNSGFPFVILLWGMGCFDHQFYDFSGGGRGILRDG